MALIDNLISYWKMDEASGDALDAHSTNDLTDTNTVAAGTGIINGARDFEANNNEYFTHVDNAALSTGDIDFTVQAWVKLETEPGVMEIVSKWGALITSAEYTMYYNGDRFNFTIGNGVTSGAVTADNFGAVATGVWYLLHAWHDAGNNLVGISVNAGTANTLSWALGVLDSTEPFRIGAGSGTPINFFDGLIDEVGFWKRVLSSDERTSLYNAGAGLAYPFSSGAVVTAPRRMLSGVGA